jgi:hypothetical protein
MFGKNKCSCILDEEYRKKRVTACIAKRLATEHYKKARNAKQTQRNNERYNGSTMGMLLV